MENKDNSALVGALMLVAGGIIGAGVALLFAPQSGKKTRRDISRYSRKVRRQAEDAIEEFSGNVQGMVEAVGEKAEDILDKGKDLAYEAKKDLLRAIEEGQTKLEKQRSRLSKLIG
jgi:gas vesicle protein